MRWRDTIGPMARIHSLEEVLRPVLARISPLKPVMVPVDTAIGGCLAETLFSPISLPARSTALRAGLAVHALDLAGASAHAPVLLMECPPHVSAGDALPEGCDAVIDPGTIAQQGPFWHATESVEPGTETRLAGHDLPRGAPIGEAGRCITPEIAFAAQQVGIEDLPVRRPQIRIEQRDSAENDWLRARLSALGCAISTGGTSADVAIRWNDSAPARLALRPADTAWIEDQSGCIVVEVPPRLECILAAWSALLLPVFAALTGATLRADEMPLARKLTSPVGIAEIVLHRIKDGFADPLASGDFPLSTIVQADAFSLTPPGFEGYAAGTPIAVTPLDRPFL
jgi:molybdopterin biosynthesis enzyme